MPLLWFDEQCCFLGDISFRDGRLLSVDFTKAGEARMGPIVAKWKTHGLEAMRIYHTPNPGHATLFTVDPVLADDQRFEADFTRWVKENGHALIVLPDALDSAWTELQRLPIDDRSKFSVLVALSHAPPEKHSAWREMIVAAMPV